jgi:hypothetical protein
MSSPGQPLIEMAVSHRGGGRSAQGVGIAGIRAVRNCTAESQLSLENTKTFWKPKEDHMNVSANNPAVAHHLLVTPPELTYSGHAS